jgi:hypothetical protein
MAFSDYKSLEQVQQEFKIRYHEEDFLPQLWIAIPASFYEEFEFNITVMDAFSSEAARCELVIFPVIREIYKRYADKSALWVQKSFAVDGMLSGTPDYMLSRKSDLGKTILETPLLLLVEAKRNDFEQGWGQCLAELVAADRLNSQSRPIYGIVTDGKLWEFGRLDHQVFTKNLASYTITDFEKLFCVLNGLFDLATQDLKVEVVR